MKTSLATLGLAAAVVTLLVLGNRGTPVEAARVTIDVEMTGAEEVPPVSGPGSASARFVYDAEARTLEYSMTVHGLSAGFVTAAHIHRGAEGTNGPVVFPLATEGFTQISGEINLTAQDVADLEGGNFYANVHSIDNPAGFARGQIVLPATVKPTPAATATPSGGGGVIRPPSTGDGGLMDTSSPVGLVVAGLLIAIGGGALILASRRS